MVKAKDLTGQRFGLLTVIERAENIKTPKTSTVAWRCLCDCGNEIVVAGSYLSKGKKNCGCVRKVCGSKPRVGDLTGIRFGKLTVIELSKEVLLPNGTCMKHWKCKCDCGEIRVVIQPKLRNGNVKSCKFCSGAVTHGASRENASKTEKRLYKSWCHMKERCYNPNDKFWHRYGGRGIRVCSEWLEHFVAFRDWALSNGYTNALTIDRVNVHGDYEPSNCRWATDKEQACNKENSVIVEFRGEKHNLGDWAKILGIGRKTLHYRLFKLELDVETALTLPAKCGQVIKKDYRIKKQYEIGARGEGKGGVSACAQ